MKPSHFSDIKTELLSALESVGICVASSVRAKIFMLGFTTLSLALGSCSGKKDKALEDINRGNYLAAATYYNPELCAKKNLATEDADNCESVEKARVATTQFRIAWARGLVNDFGNYSWAKKSFGRALELDPANKIAGKELGMAEANLVQFEKGYAETIRRLGDMLSSDAEIDDATWTEIRFRKSAVLHQNWLKLGKADYAPVKLFLDYSRKFFESGDIKKAFEATQLAEKFLKENVVEFAPEDEQFVAFVSKDFSEGVNSGQIILAKNRKAQTGIKKGESRPVLRPVAKGAANRVGGQDAEALKAVESSLAKVRKDYSAGLVFEALVGIDQEIKNLAGNPQVVKLEELRAEWEGSRKALILEYKTKADALFIAEKDEESALKIYKSILALNPSDDIRVTVEGNIGTLNAVIKEKNLQRRKSLIKK
jgi:tetratricopeptide (TPR) repeat protein